MNYHPDEVLNTVLHDIREAIPYIMKSISLDAEEVHLQMEETKRDIQDATSDYLVNTPTPNTHLLDNADDTIKYIKAFLQPHQYYSEPPTTPISKFSSPTTQEHLTADLRAEARATTAATATTSAPNAASTASMSTLDPENSL